MYEIVITKEFKKNYKKLSSKNKNLVNEIIHKISCNEILEKKYKDHALKGKLKAFRECHIKPDLLLMYQKLDKELILNCVCISSHSEIF